MTDSSDSSAPRGHAFVVGVSGAVGFVAAQTFLDHGFDVVAASRTPDSALADVLRAGGAKLVMLDLKDAGAMRRYAEGAEAVVMAPILSASANAIAAFEEAQPRRVVFISSHNVAVDPDNLLYQSLRSAEAMVAHASLSATILRPTMVYGHADDGNLSRLMRFARKSPILPLPGSGKALQQPIFFEDLGRIAAHAATWADGAGQTLTLGGPDTVSMRRLYEQIAKTAASSAKVLPLPIWPLSLLASAAAAAHLPFPVTPAQLKRVERDKSVPQMADIPAQLRPKIGLQDGLQRLALELFGLTGATSAPT